MKFAKYNAGCDPALQIFFVQALRDICHERGSLNFHGQKYFLAQDQDLSGCIRWTKLAAKIEAEMGNGAILKWINFKTERGLEIISPFLLSNWKIE